MQPNSYRTHHCNQLTQSHVGKRVKLSGWIHSKRDHGNLVFIDLRDRWGLTQCVIDIESEQFATLENVRIESVICISGMVIARSAETINRAISTGEIEVKIQQVTVESAAEILPFSIGAIEDVSEEIRLRYRYLDLRRARLRENIILRSNIINTIRTEMLERDFIEIQTPILTASSPEGARDFLVPSRRHPGKYYALPQAPQQFKQLLMVSGFERYFQIAPSFRDEDARADRSPGEFYQLDMEMSFCTQDDVFAVIEGVLLSVFKKFAAEKTTIPTSPSPSTDTTTDLTTAFPHITYEQAMQRYGSDKPDLRNPLIISDVTEAFAESQFKLFADLIKSGASVKAIKAPNCAEKSRKFFDDLNAWARNNGLGGLGYIIITPENEYKGPISKNISADRIKKIVSITEANPGDVIFFIAGKPNLVAKNSGFAREAICDALDIREKNVFRFCWIVDFPMFELDEDSGKIKFSHNPFSMPQGGMDALEHKNPLEIKAFQYDIVCNGVELSSGAIRNHKIDVMYKAFAIAGYEKSVVDKQFSGMINAFRFGAPPHGGCAPGIDRIVMLLAEEGNIREVIPFPMNQQAQDLMMNAPSEVSPQQLKELMIKNIASPPKAPKN